MNNTYSINFPYAYCFGYIFKPGLDIKLNDPNLQYYVYFTTFSLDDIVEHISSIDGFQFMNDSVKKEFVFKLRLKEDKIIKNFFNFDRSSIWKIFDIEEDLTSTIIQNFIFK